MGKRLKVLVVEREEMLAEDLYVCLRLHACDVRLVRSAQRAVDVADEFAPDLLIFDDPRAGAHGLRTLRAIRSRHPDTECILIADAPPLRQHRREHTRGVRRLLPKSFALAELTAALPSPESARGHLVAVQ